MNYNPYLNPLASNPYAQLDALRQQVQQPYTAPQQQYPQQQYPQPYQQVPNIQQLIQQEIQRQIASMQPQYPQQQLMPPAQQQPPVSPGVAILSAIGNVMTVGDQQWLSANLNGLPGFFNTADGRELVQMAISGYRKHMGAEE